MLAKTIFFFSKSSSLFLMHFILDRYNKQMYLCNAKNCTSINICIISDILQHQLAPYISLMIQLQVMYSLNKSGLWILYLLIFSKKDWKHCSNPISSREKNLSHVIREGNPRLSGD